MKDAMEVFLYLMDSSSKTVISLMKLALLMPQTNNLMDVLNMRHAQKLQRYLKVFTLVEVHLNLLQSKLSKKFGKGVQLQQRLTTVRMPASKKEEENTI